MTPSLQSDILHSEQNRIKSKILSTNPEKWWGDDFDSRFYLISKIQNIKEKKILDLGGGIGIISSEADKSNFMINLDLNISDLKTCKKITDRDIESIYASMNKLPFANNSIDVIISSSVLQYAKLDDIKMKRFEIKDKIRIYPTVQSTLSEIFRVLRENGRLLLVTPNNSYYNSYMFDFDELQYAIRTYFSQVEIFFYNTYPKISNINRKLNMANMIPKLLSKLISPDKIIENLIASKSKNNYSVSFFIEATK